ncbi:MAG: hypothetical protein DCE90_03600 [Pseudanabaena sp.]|nr:MAG: hypothetical protein DCE90_03600 [Pseudanabaena sp.]
MEVVFLIFALLKGLYSLYVALINCKNLLTRTIKFSDVSDENLLSSITYRTILLLIELFGTCLTMIPLLLEFSNMRYMLLGFAIWFMAGAIEDFTELLVYRFEQKRRQA